MTAVAWAAFGPAAARAQYEARARVGGGQGDATSATTALNPREGVAIVRTLDEQLAQMPGARAQVFGAYGSFMPLSIRGAGAEQTDVLLDRIPISSAQGLALDLSLLPLRMIERVELYRGGQPFWLGSSAIGGTLRLVPYLPSGSYGELEAAQGSFDFGRVWASAGGGDAARKHHSWVAGVGSARSAGNFSYRDDAGTPLVGTDDRTRRRSNADVEDLYAYALSDHALGTGRLRILGFAFDRDAGGAGPATLPPTRAASSENTRFIGAVHYETALRPWRTRAHALHVEALASVHRDEAQFHDRLDELKLGPRDIDNQATEVFGRVSLQTEVFSGVELTQLTRWSTLLFDQENVLAPNRSVDSHRHVLDAGLELRRVSSAAWPVEVRASARLLHYWANVDSGAVGTSGGGQSATHSEPAVRLSAVWFALPGFELTAASALGVRLPSVQELFGDGRFLVGRPSLAPERSVGIESGLRFYDRSARARWSAELWAFARWSRDLIRYVRTAQMTAVPDNIDRAFVRGLELAGDVRPIVPLNVHGALTVLHATDAERRDLPLRPTLQGALSTHLDLPLRPVVRAAQTFAQLTYTGRSYADAGNLIVLDDRAFVDVGVAIWPWDEALQLTGYIRNIGDLRSRDVLGFPTPGRSYMVSLRLQPRSGQ